MIRTLKKTISDVTSNPDIFDPVTVEQIITDLTDPYNTNIKLFSDNKKYIGKLLYRVIDFFSLFKAVNTVNDDFLNRIPMSISGPEQNLAPILRDYGDMICRYSSFNSWLKTDILLLTQYEISKNKYFTQDDIFAIKQIIKDQCTKLANKLEAKSSEIEEVVNTNKNSKTHANMLRQMRKLTEYISELRRYCVRSADMAS